MQLDCETAVEQLPGMALFTSMFANKALSVRAEGQPTHDAHLEGEKTIQKAVNRCVPCFQACTLQDALAPPKSSAHSAIADWRQAHGGLCRAICEVAAAALHGPERLWRQAAQAHGCSQPGRAHRTETAEKCRQAYAA